MPDFRKGDKVRFEGTVTDADDLRVEVRTANGAVRAFEVNVHGLELVERPGPRLEDLPEGTVIKTTDSVPLLVGEGRLIGSAMGSTVLFRQWDQQPFEVIGACPGTPAWEPWLKAFNQADGDPDYIGEWWRSE